MNKTIFIYGRHAVIEAITKRSDVVRMLHVREDLVNDAKLLSCIKQVKHRTFFGNNIPNGVDKHATHQGVIAEIDSEKLLIPFKEFQQRIEATKDTALVVLGEVQDPHNVGAIIRSAAALGASAILVPEHRGCPITGTVIKVSAGTAFTLLLVAVGNVNTALRVLKDKGFWIYGLDADGDTKLNTEKFTKPSVFVVGNEATGMRHKTHELCDTILSIQLHPNTESLNASVSAAVVLYAWSAQHPESLL